MRSYSALISRPSSIVCLYGARRFLSAVARVAPPAAFRALARVASEAEYSRLHALSLSSPGSFWGAEAEALTWRRKWDSVDASDLSKAKVAWFSGATLNVTESCLDAHVSAGYGDRPALTWEGDDGSSVTFTFAEMLRKVEATANVLKANGVVKGDVVSIYLPMIPTAVFTMLACARLGAVHSVVFAGFSDAALADRIVDGRSKIVVTADSGVRGGKPVPLKPSVDRAIAIAAADGQVVQKVLVAHRAGGGVGEGALGWVTGRDVDLDAATAIALKSGASCEAVAVGAEDPLFVLYTSGSTGKPKGVLHTAGGYAVYAKATFKYIFDARPTTGKIDVSRPPDVFFSSADVGWVTGHTYGCYGPLLAGVHSVIFEGIPTFPSPERMWQVVEKHRVTVLYTAPTAIRALMKFGDEPVKKHDLTSLRLLGTVGEPIGEDAWRWYHEVVGGERCPIVDTYWQTETGGHVLSGFPGATDMKPGAATKPFFGIDAAVVKADGSPSPTGQSGFLVFRKSWPGMARTVLNDHERYVKTYLTDFPGAYFTGDAAIMDADGCIRIVGRTDDVINVSGHRMGTAEVEAALGGHKSVAESAVVGFPHSLKGEGIYCFVILKATVTGAPTPALRAEIIATVRARIGAIATPDVVHFVHDLPKTRSGKIMRRMLRKVAAGEKDEAQMGDISTLADPTVLNKLIATRGEAMNIK